MKHRLFVSNYFVIVFSLLVVGLGGADSAAAPEGELKQSIYLPIITRPGSWQEIGVGSASGGGISNNFGNSGLPSTALDPGGNPYIAWMDETSGNREIYVRHWNGISWVEVGVGSASGGGISNNPGASWAPSIAVDLYGTLYAVWQDDYDIYVLSWNGVSWEEVGTGSATGNGISIPGGSAEYPSIAIAQDGTPYIVWSDGHGLAGTIDIYIRRWSGFTWDEVGNGSASGGGISNNNGWSEFPSIAISPDGMPYVAWQDSSSGGEYRIYIRRWNGTIWEEIGTGSASGGGISIMESGYPSVVVGQNGTPYVTWSGYVGSNSEIYILQWNGSNWVEAGTGSATGSGISNTIGDSEYSSIALTTNNEIYVAWTDNTSGGYEVYTRRWNGINWHEVGINSASGGGISNNSGDSGFWRSIAISSDSTPYVAWQDNSSGNYEIYIRRYIE